MANAPQPAFDIARFEGFTPLKELERSALERLAAAAAIERRAAGEFLFERGETRHRTYYLLEGEVELCSPLFPTHRVAAGSDAARFPLAHSFPRQFTAVTITEVRVLMLPLDVAEVMTRDQTAAKSTDALVWEKRWLSSPLLRRLSAEHKQSLLASMAELTVRAGQVVVRQDEPADSYFVIKRGRCRVSRKPSPSASEVTLAELADGQGFGEEALITGVPRNASVTMLSDGILLRLSKEAFITQMARPLLHYLPFQHAIKLVEQGAVLVDVRSPEEFESESLIGSINMPLPVLRLKAGRLNRDRTYIVYSNAGQISSVAVFLMLQQGLNACVLKGGLGSAPRERLKCGGFGNESDAGKVLSFPGVARTGADTVEWNNVSDDVLWRTTLGYRRDTGLEAALDPRPQAATSDGTLQGFDDIRLFTTIDTVQDIRLQQEETPRPRSPARGAAAGNFSTSPRPLPPRWQPKPRRRHGRPIAAFVTLLLIGGGAVDYLLLNGEGLPLRLQSASPVILDQQRKLDAKVDRLLQALETMPALQGSSNTPPPAPATPAANAKSQRRGAAPAPSPR